MRAAKVSVLMPVYNAEKYLREAIESILQQSYENFELIIIDDGSTDESSKIIQSYDDPRIRFKSRPNKGLSATLNESIKMARGVYLARQDADDISKPQRFEKQVAYLDSHSDVSLLGSNYTTIDGSGKPQGTTDVFTNPSDLKLAEIMCNQFGHGAVMIRKSILEKTGLYNPHFKIAQDTDLWNRISRHSKIANLKEPLYEWRSAGSGLSTHEDNLQKTIEEAYEIRDREFKLLLKDRSRFKLFAFNIFSVNGGIKKYLAMRNTTLRDMALLYCYRGLRRRAVPVLLLAILYAPWVKRSYRQLLIVIFNKQLISTIGYEYI